jgi:hypothetical protein
LLQEFKEYINKTYSQHYAGEKFQINEVLIDQGVGLEFFLGNVQKYASRYGKKGEMSEHRKDILKVLHYAILALYDHDKRQESN